MENLIGEPAVAYPSLYTTEEFLNMQWENGKRYEFCNGELVEMAGATLNHNRLVSNSYLTINNAASGKEKGCEAFMLDVLLGIKNRNSYFLPDLLLTCDENDLNEDRIIFYPTLIVEVLSDSTELYDRTKKWEIYRRIPSLRYYLLISQKEYHIDLYQRPNEQSLFYFQSFEGAESIINFPDLGFTISLNDIYKGIQFEKNGSPANKNTIK